MTKYIYLLLLLLYGVLSFAQTATQNYVTETIYKSGKNPSLPSLQTTNDFITTTYYDGMGRPIQQVEQNSSPVNDKNIVTHIEYEKNLGQTRKYLPFTAEGKTTVTSPFGNTTSYNSNYISDAQQATTDFYGSNGYQTGIPYSENRYEASPSKRILEAGFPGNEWAIFPEPYKDQSNTLRYSYDFNTANEVKKFGISTTWNATSEVYSNTISEAGYYAANTLKKIITKNENWKSEHGKNNTTEDFKTSDGKTVLIRTYNNNEVYDTYYVYDFYGKISYVIPPLANGSIAGTNLDKLCYQYVYDERNRLVEKKLPQKQREYLVYDKADRLVMTGPVTNPFNAAEAAGWIITKYDLLNRIIYTGFYNGHTVTAANRKVLKAMVYAQTDNNESKTTSDTTIDGVAVRYTNSRFPTALNLLTVNYYDDYDFPGAPTSFATVEGALPLQKVKGIATGSWIRVLTTATERKANSSYTLYNAKYQPIRSYTSNYLGGYMQNDRKLTFRGLPEKTVTTQKRDAATTVLTVTDNFTYDHRERIKTQTQQINGGAVTMIVENIYDELGILQTKKVGGTATKPLETVSYRYNIRGWLTDINNAEKYAAENEVKLFNLKLNYERSEYISNGTPLYNGNINSVLWRTKMDGLSKAYGYEYDHLNRLQQAYMMEFKGGWVMGFERTDGYNEILTYDKGGNIKTLKRTGELIGGQKTGIDDLAYTYDANQLLSVTDTENNNTGGFNDGNKMGNDYTYDAFGNLKTDKNKGITNIIYNYLNLPLEIVFGSEKIIYTYDAMGTVLRKTIQSSSATQITDYISGFQYLNGVLQFFPHSEGYVKPNGTNAYLYVYQYKDHLGNVRLSYADCDGNGMIDPAMEILEENNYYPFGMKHKGYNDTAGSCKSFEAEQVKYNGKEYEDSFGFNIYEYGARNYDPAVARFFNIDRLSEKYEVFSPYSYTANNPIRFIDVNGEWIFISEGINNYRYMMGGKVEQWDPKANSWVVIDQKTLSSYIKEIIKAMYELETSGPTGKAVVNYFTQNESKKVTIWDNPYVDGMKAVGKKINIDGNFKLNKIYTENGLVESSLFLALGHEMAHVIDAFEDPQRNQTWTTINLIEYKRSELFASHIENQIRSESGHPLRKFYALNKNTQEGGKIHPMAGTQIIDDKGNALFFGQTGPSIFNSIERCEVIHGKYEKIEKEFRYNYRNTNPIQKK